MSWIPKERSPAIWNRPSQTIRGWTDLEPSFSFWEGDYMADVRVVSNNKILGIDSNGAASVKILGPDGVPVNVTADGKLSVDAQVTASVADSKIKGSPDAGVTWVPVKVNANGDISVSLNGRTTAVAGKKTVAVAGTPESLGNQPVGDGVYVVADPNNAGKVYVFPAAGSKADVVPLLPGDSDFWPVSNISALKVDADVSGEGVYWKGAV